MWSRLTAIVEAVEGGVCLGSVGSLCEGPPELTVWYMIYIERESSELTLCM